ncbi:MAG: ATP-binding protein [Pseudomonadota bacterium]|nr:ATP-binding protein [Pseudomonadota bacterium]
MNVLALSRFYSRVRLGVCQGTLLTIADELCISNDFGVLGRIETLRSIFTEATVEAVPPFNKGDLDTLRSFRFIEVPDDPLLEGDLQSEESEKLEFKSTLCCDLGRLRATSKAEVSDAVTNSSLKSVAAFLNASGGRLIVGVEDDRTICGIDEDFRIAKTSSLDKWQLVFRDLITTRFHEGATIGDYVRINALHYKNKTVAIITIVPRPKLSFLKIGADFQLFVRRGNRTESVPITEIETFLVRRLQR